jgi:GT2 family glycosyltransferase
MECLRSIDIASVSLSLEIIVIDNASSDGSAEMCRALFPNVQVIQNSSNVGFGRANNQGIQSSRAEFVLLLNSDTLVFPKTLETMFDAIRRDDGIGILGCRLENRDGSPQPSCCRYPTVPVVAVERLLLYRLCKRLPQTAIQSSNHSAVECDWIMGACMMIRRAALELGGVFDPEIWLYGEELDLCYRIKRAGWRIVFDPASKIIHLGGGSWEHDSYSTTILKMAGLLRFHRTHYSTASYCATWSLVVVGAVLRSIICAVVVTGNRQGHWRRELTTNLSLLARLGTGSLLQFHRTAGASGNRKESQKASGGSDKAGVDGTADSV